MSNASLHTRLLQCYTDLRNNDDLQQFHICIISSMKAKIEKRDHKLPTPTLKTDVFAIVVSRVWLFLK